MIKYICDKCRDELFGAPGYFGQQVGEITFRLEESKLVDHIEELQLCKDCYFEVLKYAGGVGKP